MAKPIKAKELEDVRQAVLHAGRWRRLDVVTCTVTAHIDLLYPDHLI